MKTRITMRWTSFLVSSLAWATTNITSVDPTATQAVVRVTTDQAGNCSYRASEGQTIVTPVNDINTTLYPASNSDARFGSIVSGNSHTFVLGTRPSTALPMKASDGNYYSRALKAGTAHTVGVSCGSDGEVTTTFVTASGGFASPGPEFTQPYDANGAFGTEAWPTIVWNCDQPHSAHDGCGEAQQIIDPYTGFPMYRAQSTGQKGWTYQNFQIEESSIGAAFVLGTATNWTNPANFLTGPQTDCSGTCATAQSPLTIVAPLPDNNGELAAGQKNYDYDAKLVVDDAKFHLTGCGDDASSANRVMQVALSEHTALNEVDSNWVSLPALVQCSPSGTITTVSSVAGPASAPEAPFGGWTAGTSQVIRTPDIIVPSGTTTCASGVCSFVSGGFFILSWKAGDTITIAGSSPTCTSNICTIQSVQSAVQVTLSQSLTISGAAWKSTTQYGYLIRKATTTGAVHLSGVTHDIFVGNQYGENSNGAFRHFSSVSTTTTYSRAGVNDGLVRTGFCFYTITFGAGLQLYFFIPATGESRYLQALNISGSYAPIWDTVNPCAFFSSDGSNNIFSNQYSDTTYKETGWNATKGTTADYCQQDGGGCVNNIAPVMLSSGTSLISKITTAYAAYCVGSTSPGCSYDATHFPTFGISGAIGNVLVLGSTFAGVPDDAFAMRCYMDLNTTNVLSCNDSFSKAPMGWGAQHASNARGTAVAGNAGREEYNVNYLAHPSFAFNGQDAVVADITCVLSRDPGCSVPMTGICPYNTGTDSGGSCAGSFTTCPINSFGAPILTGPTFAQLGLNQCVHLTIANQPAIKDAATGIGSAYLTKWPWCSGMSGRSGVWTYVKSLEPGDGLRNQHTTSDSYNEIFLVLSISYQSSDHCDGKMDLWLWHGWDGFPASSGNPPTNGCNYSNGCTVLPGQPLYAGPASHSGSWPRFDGTNCNQSPAISNTHCQEISSINLYHGDYAQQGTGDAGVLVTSSGTTSFLRSGPNPGTFAIGQPYETFTLPSPVFNGSRAPTPEFQTHLSLGVKDLAVTPFLSDARNLANQNGGQFFWGIPSASLVGGFSHVYMSSGTSWLAASTSTYDPKNVPTYVKVGRYVLADASGPGTTFGDSNVNQFCIAYVAGQCVSGSFKGDLFVNAVFLDPTATGCGVQLDDGAVCAWTTSPYGLHLIQQSVLPDAIGDKYRRVSEILGGVGHEDGFWNSNPTPAGDYAMGLTTWANGVAGVNMIVSTPVWPEPSTVNAANYVPISVDVGSGIGTKVRVLFGYIENEPSGASAIHFYPTSRLEPGTTCIVGSDPFAYLSETQTCPTTPGGNARLGPIPVPALAGHVLYYQLQRLDGSNNVLASGPVQVVAVP